MLYLRRFLRKLQVRDWRGSQWRRPVCIAVCLCCLQPNTHIHTHINIKLKSKRKQNIFFWTQWQIFFWVSFYKTRLLTGKTEWSSSTWEWGGAGAGLCPQWAWSVCVVGGARPVEASDWLGALETDGWDASWSWTNIMWSPTRRARVSGDRPDRKSLTWTQNQMINRH